RRALGRRAGASERRADAAVPVRRRGAAAGLGGRERLPDIRPLAIDSCLVAPGRPRPSFSGPVPVAHLAHDLARSGPLHVAGRPGARLVPARGTARGRRVARGAPGGTPPTPRTA